jgi:hypothetical protein
MRPLSSNPKIHSLSAPNARRVGQRSRTIMPDSVVVVDEMEVLRSFKEIIFSDRRAELPMVEAAVVGICNE